MADGVPIQNEATQQPKSDESLKTLEKAPVGNDQMTHAHSYYTEGCNAMKNELFGEAAELLAKALEIKSGLVHAHDLSLAPWYFKYGSALYYHFKATAEILGDKSQQVIEEKSTIVASMNSEVDGIDQEEEDAECEENEESYKEDEGSFNIPETSQSPQSNEHPLVLENLPTDKIQMNGSYQSDDKNASTPSSIQPDALESESELEEDEEASEPREDIEQPTTLGAEEQIAPSNDEPGDLEIAWNVLEIARLIYAKYPDMKLQLSDVHLLLGEISMEEEKMEVARNEFEAALQIREELGKRRALAEAYFMLALVQEWDRDDKKAIDSLSVAKKLLTEESEACADEAMKGEIKQAIVDVECKIQALEDVFVPAPEDKAEFDSDQPPSVADFKFSFDPPTSFQTPTSSGGPATVLIPKKNPSNSRMEEGESNQPKTTLQNNDSKKRVAEEVNVVEAKKSKVE